MQTSMRRLRHLAGILGFAVLAIGQAATAEAQVEITEVFVDVPVLNQITIVGNDFDNGPGLQVTLGNFPPLAILVPPPPGPNQIIANLPAAILAGDFLLTVRTGGGQNRRDTYDLTIAPQPVPAIPQDAIILWDQGNVCPAGFVQVNAFNGLFLMAAAAVGGAGGAAQHAHGAGSFTGPAHRHNLEPWNGNFAPVDDNAGGTQFNARTNVAGGGTMMGNSELVNSLPPFATILLCRSL